MPVQKSQKRFIAGAVCPQCQVIDKTFTLSGDEGISRNCANCGFSEKLIDQVADVADLQNPIIQVIKIPGSK